MVVFWRWIHCTDSLCDNTHSYGHHCCQHIHITAIFSPRYQWFGLHFDGCPQSVSTIWLALNGWHKKTHQTICFKTYLQNNRFISEDESVVHCIQCTQYSNGCPKQTQLESQRSISQCLRSERNSTDNWWGTPPIVDNRHKSGAEPPMSTTSLYSFSWAVRPIKLPVLYSTKSESDAYELQLKAKNTLNICETTVVSGYD